MNSPAVAVSSWHQVPAGHPRIHVGQERHREVAGGVTFKAPSTQTLWFRSPCPSEAHFPSGRPSGHPRPPRAFVPHLPSGYLLPSSHRGCSLSHPGPPLTPFCSLRSPPPHQPLKPAHSPVSPNSCSPRYPSSMAGSLKRIQLQQLVCPGSARGRGLFGLPCSE